MTIYTISFTDKGDLLNLKISAAFSDCDVIVCTKDKRTENIYEWTKEAFSKGDALIFIGAAGIAVRAVSKFIKSKDKDPAVVVCDELGKFAVPLLSGHIGGANHIAERISEAVGLVPVITTATDINGVWAADMWAVYNNFKIYNKENIKYISAALLRGDKVGIISDVPIKKDFPENVVFGERNTRCGVVVSPYIKKIYKNTLNLIPKCIALGVGSGKNADENALVTLFKKTFAEKNIDEYAVYAVGTIDMKKNERSVLRLCEYIETKLKCFTPQKLNELDGSFSASEFVKKVTGVDNVCERCAVLAADYGNLEIKKTVGKKVTLAAAIGTGAL